MLLDPKDFLKEKYEMEFVVHAPELFPNDHILDLTSEDSSYVENSIKYANQVLDLTRELNKFFPQCTNPPVIFNIGGASDKSFHSKEKIQLLEDNFFKNFKKLNINNIDFIPQTMPPFPWHFGGQRFHNLMVEPNSIIKICKTLNLKVCLDISHSALACRFLNIDLKDFINEVSYYVRHLHIVDSKDIDGEGLQIGEGELDFNVISKILNKSCPSASFVPEIWQGHKNNGEGFWKALNYLEGLL
jgi:N-acetylneuraminate synthase